MWLEELSGRDPTELVKRPLPYPGPFGPQYFSKGMCPSCLNFVFIISLHIFRRHNFQHVESSIFVKTFKSMILPTQVL